MNALIRFFATRHFLANLITVVVLVGGVVAWNATSKEELPDITFNTVRVNTSYSGASAEDVEFYLTRPLEESLQGIDGVRRISSTSSPGNSSIAVELERSVTDVDKAVTDIQNQVNSVDLPDDVLDDPNVRVFETSKKAIIDIAIYDESAPLLSVAQRSKLQAIARGLEARLIAQPEIFEVRRSGYLQEEITIKANPLALSKYRIPLNTIAQEVSRSHVRAPAGTLKSGRFEQVTILKELDNKPDLEQVAVQGGFDSAPVPLKSVASIYDEFEDATTILKVNGREAIMFNVVKTSRAGILDALEVTKRVVGQFEANALSGSSVKLQFLDDESIDLRNRLSIITSNGILGFLLILITLFIFLNKRSGFWVAMGIPFTLSFSLICSYFMGFTINGITLSGIIIVLGIVVDDAIIVAENISRRYNEGESLEDASISGAKEVVAPVFASIATTCAAFIPLYFFTGRYGAFVQFIPPMIFLMLIASLIESFLLLPSHMTLFPSKSKSVSERGSASKVWFKKWESVYEGFLMVMLPKRYVILSAFIIMAIGAGVLVTSQFKFVMFPRTESREIVVYGEVDNAISAVHTARGIEPIETYLRDTYLGKEGIGLRTHVARGRRGDAAKENLFRITMEIVPSDKRKKSADVLIKEVGDYLGTVKGISNVRFTKSRWGQSSGSPIEVVVQENDDVRRDALIRDVMTEMRHYPGVTGVEEDVVPIGDQFIVRFNQEKLKRLSVSPENLSRTLRSVLNGQRLYTLFRNDEEIEVNLTVSDGFRGDIFEVLKVPIENSQRYLVPLGDLVTVEQIKSKKSIRRRDLKRSSFIYADLTPTADVSPLEVAEDLESRVFPKLLAKYPNGDLSFTGEITDTRESKRDLTIGILAAVVLIYLVLAVLFDSVFKPLRIMLVVPFGAIGVIFAFYLHQKTDFGFYAAIGSLGMLGVVVNDAIVMLSRLDRRSVTEPISNAFTADVAKTRLRAIILTTLTTVAGVMPTAYGFGGTDTMLSDMMIAMAWGLLFGTLITLLLTPCVFMVEADLRRVFAGFNTRLLKRFGLSLFVMGSLICVSSNAYAQSGKTNVITLSDFVSRAVVQDTAFHSMVFEQMALKYQQNAAVPRADIIVDLASDFQVGEEDEDLRTAEHTLSLTQTVPYFGQAFSVGFSQDVVGDTDDTTVQYAFSQDIARNAFGKATRLDGAIQRVKTDVAQYQLIEAYEDYLAEIMTLYYTWIRQYESWKLAKSSYAENEKVMASILRRQERKIANQTDVNKFRLQMLAKREQMVRFERDYEQTTHTIRRVLGLDVGEQVQPNTDIVLDGVPKDLNMVLADVETRSRSFSILALLDEQQVLRTDRAARELLPSIQLNGRFVVPDQTKDQTAFAGARVVLPVLNRQSRAKARIQELTERQTQIEKQTAAQRLRVDVRQLYTDVSAQKRLVDLASEKRRLARQILTEESENYSIGQINLNDYIEAVNRYDTTRFDEIDRKVSYQQLMVEWKRLTDQLVGFNAIDTDQVP